MTDIPLIFMHTGCSDYLPTTIAQARRTNKRVILIGDSSNKHLEVEHYAGSEYGDAQSERFRETFINLSGNSPDFEFFCMVRWIIIRNFLVENNLDSCMYVDSDVMVYSNCTEEMKKFANKKFAIMYPDRQPEMRWAASGHVSYWTREALDNFCNFISDTYSGPDSLGPLKKKWDYHIRTTTPGGICDMSLLWLFLNQTPVSHVGVLSDVISGSTYDDNINSAENRYEDEYRMIESFRSDDGTIFHMKEIKWKDNVPYCYNLKKNKWIRFNSLHFQGALGKLYLNKLMERFSENRENDKD